MEAILIRLLTASHNRLATIKRIVQRSNMLDTHKPSYAVKLMNMARQHNLL